MMVPPGASFPLFSASSTMASAILSFTLPEGFNASTFTRMRASVTPSFFAKRLASRRGVLPMSSVDLEMIFAMWILLFNKPYFLRD